MVTHSAVIGISSHLHNQWTNGLPPSLLSRRANFTGRQHLNVFAVCHESPCPWLCHGNAANLILYPRPAAGIFYEIALTESLSHQTTFVLQKHQTTFVVQCDKAKTFVSQFSNSHETQLGLPAYQDLSQALDTCHLHLNLLWSHGALCHRHI